jgi:hypothetical protein
MYRFGWLAYGTPRAAALELALWGGGASLITTVVVSWFTKPVPHRTPGFCGVVIVAACIALNIVFGSATIFVREDEPGSPGPA